MSPDQAQLVYNDQKDAENERERVEAETIEALSGTAIPQQSSHNSLCIGVSSWLLVGSNLRTTTTRSRRRGNYAMIVGA